ncbi:hypothetical protein PVAP13_J676601 [Panicum virgatum]|nr:hypothetical protein PVAP13_J676601 [Panicum virgatum]
MRQSSQNQPHLPIGFQFPAAPRHHAVVAPSHCFPPPPPPATSLSSDAHGAAPSPPPTAVHPSIAFALRSRTTLPRRTTPSPLRDIALLRRAQRHILNLKL